MGFVSKMAGLAAMAGFVGGVLYVKNRYETRNDRVDLKDIDDMRFIDLDLKSNTETGKHKVTMTYDQKKAKMVADGVADKVIDATEYAIDTAGEKLGPERINKISNGYKQTVEMVNDTKDKIVDKIGEENIDMAKERIKDAVNNAVEAIDEKVVRPVKDSAKTASSAEKDDVKDVPVEEPTVTTKEPVVATEEPKVASEEPKVATEEPKVSPQNSVSDDDDFMDNELDEF